MCFQISNFGCRQQTVGGFIQVSRWMVEKSRPEQLLGCQGIRHLQQVWRWFRQYLPRFRLDKTLCDVERKAAVLHTYISHCFIATHTLTLDHGLLVATPIGRRQSNCASSCQNHDFMHLRLVCAGHETKTASFVAQHVNEPRANIWRSCCCCDRTEKWLALLGSK